MFWQPDGIDCFKWDTELCRDGHTGRLSDVQKLSGSAESL